MTRTPCTRRGSGRAAPAAATNRADTIATLYADSHDTLKRYVARATNTDPQTIEDACSHAWAQLLSHPAVDLGAERCSILRWLTTTATRHAWQLQQTRRMPARAEIDGYTDSRDAVAPSAEDLAALRARIDLVRELPERPRRFLVRLMLGYTYHEIAALEGVSWTTTNKQIARAKRALRELEQRESQ